MSQTAPVFQYIIISSKVTKSWRSQVAKSASNTSSIPYIFYKKDFKQTICWQLIVTFFEWLSDLQLGDEKPTI